MARGSSRTDVLKLEGLIRDYINSQGDSSARIEVSNMIIEGEDLTSVLDNIQFETEAETEENERLKNSYEDFFKEHEKLKKNYNKLTEKYNKLEQDYNENLTQDIQKLIKGKTGPFADKIRKLMGEDK